MTLAHLQTRLRQLAGRAVATWRRDALSSFHQALMAPAVNRTQANPCLRRSGRTGLRWKPVLSAPLHDLGVTEWGIFEEELCGILGDRLATTTSVEGFQPAVDVHVDGCSRARIHRIQFAPGPRSVVHRW